MNAATPRRYTFRKAERLSSRKAIEELVSKGKIISMPPFKLTWIITPLETDFPAQIAFSVPKRFFKKAVDRNRMKRLMRESYRKNKADIYPLIQERKIQVALLCYFSGKSIITYNETEEKLKLILQRFAKDIITHTS